MFTPKNISNYWTLRLFDKLPEEQLAVANILKETGWKFYCVEQTRGYCLESAKTITIPRWVMFESDGNIIQYICHEMAHALAPASEMHGPKFMEILMKICPAKYLHYELEYKPREARKAGIRKPREVSETNAQGAL